MTLFLTFDEVVEIHSDQIQNYGGSFGIRDENLLRSAIVQPEIEFAGVRSHPSISTQAAAYLFHIVKNHPFVDGNKRTGVACCLVFLYINGYELDPILDHSETNDGPTKLELLVIGVVTGEIDKEAASRFLETYIQKS